LKLFSSLKDENGRFSNNIKPKDIRFYKHGIVDFNTVKGLRIDLDKGDK
jgi:hypothetical protein